MFQSRYIRDNGLGGAFIWSLEMDDFSVRLQFVYNYIYRLNLL